MHKNAKMESFMNVKTGGGGLISKNGNLTLKPIKKLDYKAFCDFSVAYDKMALTLEEFLEVWASKEFLFLQTGKLWLYLFEKQTEIKFDAGEIVGYVEVTPNLEMENTAEIGYFVKKSKRNLGYAKKMLSMALEVCKFMEFETLTAKVDAGNAPSISILKNANFEISEKQQDETIFAKLKVNTLLNNKQ